MKFINIITEKSFNRAEIKEKRRNEHEYFIREVDKLFLPLLEYYIGCYKDLDMSPTPNFEGNKELAKIIQTDRRVLDDIYQDKLKNECPFVLKKDFERVNHNIFWIYVNSYTLSDKESFDRFASHEPNKNEYDLSEEMKNRHEEATYSLEKFRKSIKRKYY